MSRRHLAALLATIATLVACGPDRDDDPTDAGTGTPDAGTIDAGTTAPAGMPKPPSTVATADATCSNGRRVFIRRAVDGDTLEVSDNLPQHEHIRLVGVNTPETHPEDAVECWGREAEAWTKAVIVNKIVCLTYDPAVTRQSNNKDAYGRTLGYVWFGTDNSRFFNAELVYTGQARDFPFTNGAVYESYLRDLKYDARDAKRGLWGRCR